MWNNMLRISIFSLLLPACTSFTLLSTPSSTTSSLASITKSIHRHQESITVRANSRSYSRSNSRSSSSSSSTAIYSEWADFAALEDDDDEDFDSLSEQDFGFANENDPQEVKAEVGMTLEAPEVDWIGDPIFLPQGSVLPLTEENVQGVLAACRQEIGTMFGYTAENRGVGITGGVDYVEMDGPIVVLSLKGRYWHQRTTVLDRVGSYIMGRIPEIVDVTVHDEWELTDEANDLAA